MIGDFLTDRTAVGASSWRVPGVSPSVSDPVSQAVSSGVSNGISDFLNSQPADGGPRSFDMNAPAGDGTFGFSDIFGRERAPTTASNRTLGSTLSSIGTALSFAGAAPMGASLAGNMLGTGYEVLDANQSLSRKGMPEIGLGGWLEGVAKNMTPGFIERILESAFGVGMRDVNQQMLDNLDQGGYFAGLAEDDMARGQAAYDRMGYSSYISDEDQSYGYGWGGTDQWGGSTGGGSANEGGGGWGGGSSESDVESGGDW